MRNATFRQLRIFTEVAKNLSFARAAETLYLTPPAVTMQIKELENHVGLPLFERSGKKVSLTTVGEYMLVYARKILATVKDAEDAADSLRRADRGLISIGMVGTATYFMMELLSKFRKSNPNIELKISTGNREHLIDMMKGNEVDLAIMGSPPKELQTRALPFAPHPHVFVASVSHPLANKKGKVVVEDLRDCDFLVREHGSGVRGLMVNFLANNHIEPKIKMHIDDNEIIKQAVMANLGVSFLSLHTIGAELTENRIAMINIEGTPVIREWNVIHNLSKVLSPVTILFRDFIIENGGKFLDKKFAHLY